MSYQISTDYLESFNHYYTSFKIKRPFKNKQCPDGLYPFMSRGWSWRYKFNNKGNVVRCKPIEPGFHFGNDIMHNVGLRVRTPVNGYVLHARFRPTWGNYVTLVLDGFHPGWNGKKTKYLLTIAHFSEILVKKNQHVTKWTDLGFSGCSGNSTQPHSHWELAELGDGKWPRRPVKIIWI